MGDSETVKFQAKITPGTESGKVNEERRVVDTECFWWFYHPTVCICLDMNQKVQIGPLGGRTHVLDFNDGGFAVLVPCYKPGCKALVDGHNNKLLSAIENLPNGFYSAEPLLLPCSQCSKSYRVWCHFSFISSFQPICCWIFPSDPLWSRTTIHIANIINISRLTVHVTKLCKFLNAILVPLGNQHCAAAVVIFSSGLMKSLEFPERATVGGIPKYLGQGVLLKKQINVEFKDRNANKISNEDVVVGYSGLESGPLELQSSYMDEKVKNVLKLLEEDGDSFVRRAEIIIASVFPEQLQFAMEDEDEFGSPKSAKKSWEISKGGYIPYVPENLKGNFLAVPKFGGRVDEGKAIADDEACVMEEVTDLKSCSDTLAQLEDKQEISAKEAQVEKKRIIVSRKKLDALKKKFELNQEEFKRLEQATGDNDDIQKRKEIESLREKIKQQLSDVKKKLREMEEKLNEIQDFSQSFEDQNNSLQTHFTEAHCSLDHLSEKVLSIKEKFEKEQSSSMAVKSSKEKGIKDGEKKLEMEKTGMELEEILQQKPNPKKSLLKNKRAMKF
ncbi:hypothetical protein F3Y22_tig00110432pilonHSYRG00121 [Hibiscus syriacus]|uniref:NET2A-D/KIP1-like alpha-helical domain-containing protein n=1 Tax=Hibiscus syriacus TaxID=106335 RepID=A0A6A3ALM7_HIBSY|nr:hypothetical protein F3Y22_tig00110432pilonHSYRG00121 [Hibiscus syriacus]